MLAASGLVKANMADATDAEQKKTNGKCWASRIDMCTLLSRELSAVIDLAACTKLRSEDFPKTIAVETCFALIEPTDDYNKGPHFEDQPFGKYT